MAEARPVGLVGRTAQPSLTPDQSVNRWAGPSSPGPATPFAFAPQISQRKRRTYADYRELLALESQGRKLNAPGSAAARLLVAEERPRSDERGLYLGENDRRSGFAQGIAADQSCAFGSSKFAPEERRALLVVDQRMNMFFGTQRNLKSVVAVNAAAVLAWQIFAREKYIGAMVFNDREVSEFSLGCSRLHTLLILQNILNQNHNLVPDAGIRSNPGMLNDVLRRLDTPMVVNSLIYLITDASGCDAETSQLATNISRQNDLVVILVYDLQQTDLGLAPARAAGPAIDMAGDRAGACPPSGGKNQRMSDHLRLSMGRLLPEGIPLIPLDTRHDIARQLRRAFADPMFPALVRCDGASAQPVQVHP